MEIILDTNQSWLLGTIAKAADQDGWASVPSWDWLRYDALPDALIERKPNANAGCGGHIRLTDAGQKARFFHIGQTYIV